jgi:hypothetical protein
MSISEIYALAPIMGLHLSPSARHERAYRDLMTFIDDSSANADSDAMVETFHSLAATTGFREAEPPWSN